MKNNYHLNDLRRGSRKHVNEGLEKHSIFFYAFSSSNQFTFSFHGDLLFGFFPLSPFAIFPSAHLQPICKFTSSEASPVRVMMAKAMKDYLSSKNTTCSKTSSIKIYILSNNERGWRRSILPVFRREG